MLSMISFFSFHANAFEEDKNYHVLVSTGIGFAANAVFDSQYSSLGACVAVGFSYEVYQHHRYDAYSNQDMVANIVGCGLGIALNELSGLKFDFKSSNETYMINLRFDY